MNNANLDIDIEPESVVIDDEAVPVQTADTRHEWRQEGPFVKCISCKLAHAHHIGADKLLIGVDADGMPKLKKR